MFREDPSHTVSLTHRYAPPIHYRNEALLAETADTWFGVEGVARVIVQVVWYTGVIFIASSCVIFTASECCADEALRHGTGVMCIIFHLELDYSY
ncbi:hypothetical protein BDR05DRAFT_966107 [Suillus weaverae]|nr:hypothetical protein BDR05DRAFT_966107 [Suillus weaverae]